MAEQGARTRLAAAALQLFDTDGFNETTVDDIAAHAGLSKTTFFRHFRSKEEAIFPDHDATIREITTMFSLADGTDRLNTVCLGAKHVLSRYVEEGELARSRFRLTSTVTALRDRELASVQRYQRLFQRYLLDGVGDDWQERLSAEIQASAVVTGNNFVIRRWLRGDTDDPLTEFDAVRLRLLAADWSVFSRDEAPSGNGRVRPGSSVVVIDTGEDAQSVLAKLSGLFGSATQVPSS